MGSNAFAPIKAASRAYRVLYYTKTPYICTNRSIKYLTTVQFLGILYYYGINLYLKYKNVTEFLYQDLGIFSKYKFLSQDFLYQHWYV